MTASFEPPCRTVLPESSAHAELRIRIPWVLFGITKHGLVPGKYAPPKYQSDMPAFAGQLSDEDIWAVFAFIKSTWPDKIQAAQAQTTREAARR